MVGAIHRVPPRRWQVGELHVTVAGKRATIEGPRVLNGSVRDVAWPGDELREVVRFDDRGRYRPLPGAKSLPGGWRVRCDISDLDAVIETVYPLATVHREQWGQAALREVCLDSVLSRQSGRYAVAGEIDAAGRQVAQRVLCAGCVRTPVWGGERLEDGGIPCPEACSVFVSLCREAALWQQAPPPTLAADPDVPFAAFEREGNEVREAFLQKRYGGSGDDEE